LIKGSDSSWVIAEKRLSCPSWREGVGGIFVSSAILFPIHKSLTYEKTIQQNEYNSQEKK
ncbi:MAG: hypothetical protein ACKO43_05395, partial [Alphaproteobacteria bacterium]